MDHRFIVVFRVYWTISPATCPATPFAAHLASFDRRFLDYWSLNRHHFDSDPDQSSGTVLQSRLQPSSGTSSAGTF
jgi:hypothetical protein